MNKGESIKNIIKYKEKIDECIHMKYHELAQKHGLRLEQFHLLVELDELMILTSDKENTPTVSEIAKKFNNSQNTMSERITRLENKGLLKREKDSRDKRISRVTLTEEGRSLIKVIASEAESKFVVDSISKLEDEEINSLSKLLEKVLNSLS